MRRLPRIIGWAVGLAGCAHVPVHAPVTGTWSITLDRRLDPQTRGELCAWEAEQLRFDGQPLWVTPPPEGEGACPPGLDYTRTVDIVGADGPFLATVLREVDAAVRVSTVRCVTWDLTTLRPATLAVLNPKLAAHWWSVASGRLVDDPSLAGWMLAADSFVVRDRHLVFCLVRGDELRELPVR